MKEECVLRMMGNERWEAPKAALFMLLLRAGASQFFSQSAQASRQEFFLSRVAVLQWVACQPPIALQDERRVCGTRWSHPSRVWAKVVPPTSPVAQAVGLPVHDVGQFEALCLQTMGRSTRM